MAGLSTDIWEVRETDGHALNGGGFDTASGGTDYSNQAAAQATWTNLSSLAASTTITDDDAGGLFTSQMVGNYMQVDGEFVRVVTFTDSDNVIVDRDPGTFSGESGRLGGALTGVAVFDATNWWTQIWHAAGSKIWVRGGGQGTITPTATFQPSGAGAVDNYYRVEGYDTARGDCPIGTGRPYFDITAAHFLFDGHYFDIAHIRGQTSSSVGLRIQGLYSRLRHVLWHNTGAGPGINCSGTGSQAIACKATSASGIGFQVGANGVRLMHCWADDCTIGIRTDQSYCTMYRCVLSNCDVGISLKSEHYHTILATTFSGNTKDIGSVNSAATVIIENVLDGAADGAEWDNERIDATYMNANCWNATTDVTNVDKGPDAVTGDPDLNDPASDDFTLGASTVATNVGQPFPDGLVGDYIGSAGVDQSEGDGSGGGGGSTTIVVED